MSGLSAGGGGFMDELKAFLISKTLWDTNADSEAVIEDFLQGYFGKAGKPMGEFLELLHRRAKRGNIHGRIFQGVGEPLLTPRIMEESERLFDEAESLADDSAVLDRVKKARLSIEYVKIIRQVNAAHRSGDADEKSEALAALESFVEACEAAGITRLTEWQDIRPQFEELSGKLK